MRCNCPGDSPQWTAIPPWGLESGTASALTHPARDDKQAALQFRTLRHNWSVIVEKGSLTQRMDASTHYENPLLLRDLADEELAQVYYDDWGGNKVAAPRSGITADQVRSMLIGRLSMAVRGTDKFTGMEGP